MVIKNMNLHAENTIIKRGVGSDIGHTFIFAAVIVHCDSIDTFRGVDIVIKGQICRWKVEQPSTPISAMDSFPPDLIIPTKKSAGFLDCAVV